MTLATKAPCRRVDIPAGRCPVPLTGTDREAVQQWSREVVAAGRSRGLWYTADAVRYYAQQVYPAGTPDGDQVRTHLIALGSTVTAPAEVQHPDAATAEATLTPPTVPPVAPSAGVPGAMAESVTAATTEGVDAPEARDPSGSSADVIVQLPIDQLRLHPAAEQVPAMRPDEWQPFAADVRDRGVVEPLLVQAGGVILDGRHRWRAAQERGDRTVPARVVDLSEAEQAAWVYASALFRRHLSDDQRAVLAARWHEAAGRQARQQRAAQAGRAGGRGRARADSSEDASSPKLSAPATDDPSAPSRRTREVAAERFQVPERKVRQAVRLEQAAPAVASQVLAGEIPLARAAAAVAPRQQQNAAAADAATPPAADAGTGPGRGQTEAKLSAAQRQRTGDTATARRLVRLPIADLRELADLLRAVYDTAAIRQLVTLLRQRAAGRASARRAPQQG